MRVICQSNSGKDLPVSMLNSTSGLSAQTEFYIKRNEKYNVYAILFRGGIVYFGISSCPEDGYFRWMPKELFKIVDARIPRGWVVNEWTGADVESLVFSAEFIAKDPEFYDQIIRQDEAARSRFLQYKESADVEFLDEDITKRPTIIGDGWISCALCSYAWKAEGGVSEMIRCPNCAGLMRAL